MKPPNPTQPAINYWFSLGWDINSPPPTYAEVFACLSVVWFLCSHSRWELTTAAAAVFMLHEWSAGLTGQHCLQKPLLHLRAVLDQIGSLCVIRETSCNKFCANRSIPIKMPVSNHLFPCTWEERIYVPASLAWLMSSSLTDPWEDLVTKNYSWPPTFHSPQ